MPVVAPLTSTPPTDGPAAPPPVPGFEQALDAATAAGQEGAAEDVADDLPAPGTPVSQLPSVGLARMIQVRAETGTATTAPPAVDGADGPGAAAGAGGVQTASLGAGGDPHGVLAAGERYLGVPYRWGGTDPASGFDCSGFVQRVYADLGVSLPRVSVDQSRAGTAVASMDQAQPGDLVFWRASGGRPNHIGIYAGGGEMLVAPRTGDVVRYQAISRTPDAIRRVL